MQAAGIPVESSKGEAWPGQHEINFRYADALRDGRQPRDLQERRQGDRPRERLLDHVHGQAGPHLDRQLLPHPREPLARRRERLRRPRTRSSTAFLAGWIACADASSRCSSRRTSTPTSATPPASWAPTTLAWGRDNRTCGFRIVGHGAAQRVETRIPGGDVNPYLAFAALIAAGLARDRAGPRAAAAARGERLRVGRGALPRDAARGDRRARGRDDGARRRSATRSSTTTSTTGAPSSGSSTRSSPAGSASGCSSAASAGDARASRMVLNHRVGLTVINPATEKPIAELERAALEETDAAVARAKAAYPAWRAVSPSDRARLLRRLATLVEEHAEELARIESRERRQADLRRARRGRDGRAGLPLLRRRRRQALRRDDPGRRRHRRRPSASRSASSARSSRGTSRSTSRAGSSGRRSPAATPSC